MARPCTQAQCDRLRPFACRGQGPIQAKGHAAATNAAGAGAGEGRRNEKPQRGKPKSCRSCQRTSNEAVRRRLCRSEHTARYQCYAIRAALTRVKGRSCRRRRRRSRPRLSRRSRRRSHNRSRSGLEPGPKSGNPWGSKSVTMRGSSWETLMYRGTPTQSAGMNIVGSNLHIFSAYLRTLKPMHARHASMM